MGLLSLWVIFTTIVNSHASISGSLKVVKGLH
jgi:hypothetical protein